MLGLELKIYWGHHKGFTHMHTCTQHNCIYLASVWHQSSKLGEKTRMYIIVVKYLPSFSYYSWIFRVEFFTYRSNQKTPHCSIQKTGHTARQYKEMEYNGHCKFWYLTDSEKYGYVVICVTGSSCRKYQV